MGREAADTHAEDEGKGREEGPAVVAGREATLGAEETRVAMVYFSATVDLVFLWFRITVVVNAVLQKTAKSRVCKTHKIG
jgi:hypothetical protein